VATKLLVRSKSPREKHHVAWIEDLEEATTHIVNQTSADQFSTSLEEDYCDAVKLIVVEDVLPSLFYVARYHENHQTEPTSDLTTIVEWNDIIPMQRETTWREDTTDCESDIEPPRDPAARCSPMVGMGTPYEALQHPAVTYEGVGPHVASWPQGVEFGSHAVITGQYWHQDDDLRTSSDGALL
jgi:hypothetical protein